MASTVTVQIHSSQFPENIQDELLTCLHHKAISHKFHYESLKQAQKWLALYRKYSPFANEPNCRAAYESSFAGTVARIEPRPVHMISLGCGNGEKDLRLMAHLERRSQPVHCTLCDVSPALVIAARNNLARRFPGSLYRLHVCDLSAQENWFEVMLEPAPADSVRLVTFFGMLSNFEPVGILDRLGSFLRRGDLLLLSTNLVDGTNYKQQMENILPQYDNSPTRDWLMTFLIDLGVEKADGEVVFKIEPSPTNPELLRFGAYFELRRAIKFRLWDNEIRWEAGESVRLFYSYRFQPIQIAKLGQSCGLRVLEEWIAPNGEEGLFLCDKAD